MTRSSHSSHSPTAPDLLFYDGDCGLCHASVRFAVRRDADRRFRFAPIGGATFSAHPAALAGRQLPDSVIVATATGEVYLRGRAICYLLSRLPAPWPIVSTLLGLLPTPVLDLGYRAVARVRKRLFAPPPAVCPVLPPGLGQRFDP